MRVAALKRAPIQIAPNEPSLPREAWLEFASYLARKYSISGDLLSRLDPAKRAAGQRKLRDLWELTDLSANDFADEVSRFFKVPRVSLPQLLAASPLCVRFSGRFLREMAVYPCQTEKSGAYKLAVADPSDFAAARVKISQSYCPSGLARNMRLYPMTKKLRPLALMMISRAFVILQAAHRSCAP